MTKPRRGRPLIGAEKATATIRLRVEPGTARRWRGIAQALGIPLAEWIRRRCG